MWTHEKIPADGRPRLVVVAPAVPELPPIARVAEADAIPRALPVGIMFVVVAVLSLALWGVIVGIVILLLR
jgi:hypothetical protein